MDRESGDGPLLAGVLLVAVLVAAAGFLWPTRAAPEPPPVPPVSAEERGERHGTVVGGYGRGFIKGLSKQD